MSTHSHSIVTKQVPCPFCSLLCDDLTVKNQQDNLKVLANGCQKSIAKFQTPLSIASPLISGQKTTLEEALAHSVNIIKNAKAPLIAGLGTDVDGIRATIALAERSHAHVDHMHSDGLSKTSLVLQDIGWVTTSLSEIKNRADVVLFVGTDATDYPRFFERIIWPKYALHKKHVDHRKIIYLGNQLNTKPGIAPDGRKPMTLKCNPNSLLDVISALRAIISNQPFKQSSVSGISTKRLLALTSLLEKANYGVIIWAPDQLPNQHRELVLYSLSELLQRLNQKIRCAGLPLGGNDGGISAAHVSAWQTGYPLRINFQRGYPTYQPYQGKAEDLLNQGMADALIWISSFSSKEIPATTVPKIVFGTDNMATTDCEVFIPVGIPGVDHSGQLLRMDSVVSMRLKQLRRPIYPSVAEIIQAIYTRI